VSFPVLWRPQFIEGSGGDSRFVLDIAPPTEIARKGAILCIQPFAEEANLSRRVLVAQATRLALEGWTVTIPDLYGTGDSAGSSQDVTLAHWRADLDLLGRRARREFMGASPRERFIVWGVRLGTALASDFLNRCEQPADGLLLWQPSMNGAAMLGQAMRPGLRATDKPVSTEAASKGAAQGARSDSPLDSCIPVLGYRYRRALVEDLRLLEVAPPAAADHPNLPVAIVHMTRGAAVSAPGSPVPALPTSIRDLAERWSVAGCDVRARVAKTGPFWSSVEPSTPTEAFETTEGLLAEA
jgi:exosortase A-associated hydrolase 2